MGVKAVETLRVAGFVGVEGLRFLYLRLRSLSRTPEIRAVGISS